MRSSDWEKAQLVFLKEIANGSRDLGAGGAMLMFAFTALSAVSLALAGATPEPRLAAALLWIVLFFASTAGVDRLFAGEAAEGSLPYLRLYAPGNAALLGKLLYALLTLSILSAIAVPLFLVLIGGTATDPLGLLAVVALGIVGLSAAGTLVEALAAFAKARNGLVSILLFPVVLPVFLPAISLTGQMLEGGVLDLRRLLSIGIYDFILISAASLLFAYVWDR